MSLGGRGFIGAGVLLAMYAYVAGRSFIDHAQRSTASTTYHVPVSAAPIESGSVFADAIHAAALGAAISPEDQGMRAEKKGMHGNNLATSREAREAQDAASRLERSPAGVAGLSEGQTNGQSSAGRWPLTSPSLVPSGMLRPAALSSGPKRLGYDLSGKRLQASILCSMTGECAYLDTLASAIKTQTHTLIEQLYAGKVPDLSGQPSTNASIEVPICNRHADAFDGNESATNHLGQSCGASTCSLKPRGKTDAPPIVDMKSCQTERAWARGELIHDIDKALDDVLTEFTVNHHVYVSDRCTSIANDPNLCLDVSNYNSVVGVWVAVNGGRPLTCDLSTDQNFDPKTNPETIDGLYINDRRIPIQAGCHLNSGYSALWSALASMSVCEVFSRADINWNNNSMPNVNAAFSKAILGAASSCGSPTSANCLTATYAETIADSWDAGLASSPGPAPASTPAPSASSSPHPSQYVVACAKNAADCKCSDLSFCGTGSALSRIELFTLSNAVQGLRTAVTSLDAAVALLSPQEKLALGLDSGTSGTSSCYDKASN